LTYAVSYLRDVEGWASCEAVVMQLVLGAVNRIIRLPVLPLTGNHEDRPCGASETAQGADELCQGCATLVLRDEMELQWGSGVTF